MLTALATTESASTFFSRVCLKAYPNRFSSDLEKSPFPYLFKEGWITSNATSLLVSEIRLFAFPSRTRLLWWTVSMTTAIKIVRGLAAYNMLA